MRLAQEAREKAAHTGRAHELTRKQRDLRRRRAGIDAQMAALRAEVEDIDGEARILREQDEARERTFDEERAAAAARRGADTVVTIGKTRKWALKS
jgi:chromosome segregation ATPase